MKKFRVALFASAAVAAGLIAAPALAEITIGVAGPLTGPNAAFGEQMRRGAEQAVKDINAAGGVNGEELVLVLADDASDPRQGVAAANELVGEGVVDRKSTRLNSVTNAHLVCRLLLEKKHTTNDQTTRRKTQN